MAIGSAAKGYEDAPAKKARRLQATGPQYYARESTWR